MSVVQRAAGLRERKKQRTRDELIHAAQRLFLCRGYARTTVDEIAAEVEVSQRTFFRYFASKEEVALALVSEAEDRFLEHLRARPAEEAPLPAMRAALRETWQEFGAPQAGPAASSTALDILQLVERTPSLVAAHLLKTAERCEVVAQVLAEREGLDPAADLRPHVLAAAFSAVTRMAYLDWAKAAEAGEGYGTETLLLSMEDHLRALGPALAHDWR